MFIYFVLFYFRTNVNDCFTLFLKCVHSFITSQKNEKIRYCRYEMKKTNIKQFFKVYLYLFRRTSVAREKY